MKENLRSKIYKIALSFSVICPVKIYARMKSHLHDTVTLPFLLLLLLPQRTIYNEKEKVIKAMSKTKQNKKRITDAVTHLAKTSASTHGTATASRLLIPSLDAQLLCKAVHFPSFSLVQTHLSRLLSSTCLAAQLMTPSQLAAVRAALLTRGRRGACSGGAANGLLPRHTCRQWHPLPAPPHQPRGNITSFPQFCNQDLHARGKRVYN